MTCTMHDPHILFLIMDQIETKSKFRSQFSKIKKIETWITNILVPKRSIVQREEWRYLEGKKEKKKERKEGRMGGRSKVEGVGHRWEKSQRRKPLSLIPHHLWTSNFVLNSHRSRISRLIYSYSLSPTSPPPPSLLSHLALAPRWKISPTTMPATDTDFDLRVWSLSHKTLTFLRFNKITLICLIYNLWHSLCTPCSLLLSPPSASGTRSSVFCGCRVPGFRNFVSLGFGCVFQGVRLCRCGKLGALCQVFESDARDLRISSLARSFCQRSGAEWFLWIILCDFVSEVLIFAFFRFLVAGFSCTDLQLHLLSAAAEAAWSWI